MAWAGKVAAAGGASGDARNLIVVERTATDGRHLRQEFGALDADAAEPLVDAVCTNIIALLHEQGLSELDDGYLERQAYAVTGGIADTAIRNLPVLMG